jgi:hypothetical protein
VACVSIHQSISVRHPGVTCGRLLQLSRWAREGQFKFIQSSALKSYVTVSPSTNRSANMRSPVNALLRKWYDKLGLARQTPPSWYRDRLREELLERRTARWPMLKLSETADVFLTVIRARYDGFPIRTLPSFMFRQTLISYMITKYIFRWKLYRTTVRLCGSPDFTQVCEVVNPRKDHKLNCRR